MPTRAPTDAGSIASACSNVLQSRFPVCRRQRPLVQSPAAHDQIARIRIGRVFLLEPLRSSLDQLEQQGLIETADDFLLGLCKVGAVGVKPVGPDVGAVLGIDQLGGDLNLAAGPPHAAFEDIADAELAADLPDIDRLALVGKGGGAGDDKAVRNKREVGGQIVGDAVGEIFLLRVVRQIRERQDDDRQAGRCGACSGGRLASDRLRWPGRHRCGEDIAAPPHCLDDLPARVAERPAHVADALRQRVVADDHVRPHRIDQLVFGYQAAGIGDEIAQELEAFWPELDFPVRVANATAGQVESISLERKDTSARQHHGISRTHRRLQISA